NEASGSATITITRAGGTDGMVGATVTLTAGTATATADYDATARTISFPSGDNTDQTISVPIVNDALNEVAETINLALRTPTGGAIVGAQSAATLTIQDDDPLPSLSIGDRSVAEGNGSTTHAVFTVSLSGASGQTVTVAAQTADGTATAGSDYTATGPSML